VRGGRGFMIELEEYTENFNLDITTIVIV